MKVAIRADASVQIGTGHVMRCLTLAEDLRNRGADVQFFCREHDGNLCDWIGAKGFLVERLPMHPDVPTAKGGKVGPAGRFRNASTGAAYAGWLGADWKSDAAETVSAISKKGPVDWLIVDHYAIDARWESTLRSLARRIMVVDDLADRPHDCEILLDQNLYPDMQRRYDGLVPSTCRMLLGPRYALLRPEFAAARETLRVRTGGVKRVLVSFGGVDATNETRKAVEALGLLDDPELGIDIVIGKANPNRAELASLCRETPGARLHIQTNQMAALLGEADLAIGAGGVATWERCALGVPAIAWPIAENQHAVIRAAASAGAILTPDAESAANGDALAKHIFSLIHAPQSREVMSRAGMSLCDGRGTPRVAQAISASSVALRSAREEDCDVVYQWRNDPAIREVSLSGVPISLESHRAWFRKTLADARRALLIAEASGARVGVLRYDLRDDAADVSIFLAPQVFGRGLGREILAAGERWLRLSHPEVRALRATVLDRNQPSKALFDGAGYFVHHLVYEKALGE